MVNFNPVQIFYLKVKYNCLNLPSIYNTEGVAQLVRALVCGTRGRGFDSPLSPQKAGFPAFFYAL